MHGHYKVPLKNKYDIDDNWNFFLSIEKHMKSLVWRWQSWKTEPSENKTQSTLVGRWAKPATWIAKMYEQVQEGSGLEREQWKENPKYLSHIFPRAFLNGCYNFIGSCFLCQSCFFCQPESTGWGWLSGTRMP